MLAAPLLLSLLGQPVPQLPEKPAERWVQGGPLTLASLRGRVVLIRFFTGTECPHCSKTAPALNALHREFGERGLVVIGVYTPKPSPRPVAASEVRAVVKEYAFEFPVVIDDDWSALRALWLDRVPGAEFTSASLLSDRDGVLRRVHEGGTWSDEEARAMRETIAALLGG
jgi:peroxiredoxin